MPTETLSRTPDKILKTPESPVKLDKTASPYRIGSPRPRRNAEITKPSELWISPKIDFNYGQQDKGEQHMPVMFREGTFAVRPEDVREHRQEDGEIIIPPLLAFCHILKIAPPTDAKDLNRFVKELFTKPKKGEGGNYGSHFEPEAVAYLTQGTAAEEAAKDTFYQEAIGPKNADKCGEIKNKDGTKEIHLHAELDWHNGAVLAALRKIWNKGPDRAGELLEKKGENFPGLSGMSPERRLDELEIEILRRKNDKIIERHEHIMKNPDHVGCDHDHGDHDHDSHDHTEHEELGEELSWKERNHLLSIAMISTIMKVADKETLEIASNEGTGWGSYQTGVSEAAALFNTERTAELHETFKEERAKYNLSRESVVAVLEGMHQPVDKQRQQKFAEEFHSAPKMEEKDWKAFEEKVKNRFRDPKTKDNEIFHDIAVYFLTEAFAITTDPNYSKAKLTEKDARILRAAGILNKYNNHIVRDRGEANNHDGEYHGLITMKGGQPVKDQCPAHPPQKADKKMQEMSQRNTQKLKQFAKGEPTIVTYTPRRAPLGGAPPEHPDPSKNRPPASDPSPTQPREEARKEAAKPPGQKAVEPSRRTKSARAEGQRSTKKASEILPLLKKFIKTKVFVNRSAPGYDTPPSALTSEKVSSKLSADIVVNAGGAPQRAEASTASSAPRENTPFVRRKIAETRSAIAVIARSGRTGVSDALVSTVSVSAVSADSGTSHGSSRPKGGLLRQNLSPLTLLRELHQKRTQLTLVADSGPARSATHKTTTDRRAPHIAETVARSVTAVARGVRGVRTEPSEAPLSAFSPALSLASTAESASPPPVRLVLTETGGKRSDQAPAHASKTASTAQAFYVTPSPEGRPQDDVAVVVAHTANGTTASTEALKPSGNPNTAKRTETIAVGTAGAPDAPITARSTGNGSTEKNPSSGPKKPDQTLDPNAKAARTKNQAIQKDRVTGEELEHVDSKIVEAKGDAAVAELEDLRTETKEEKTQVAKGAQADAAVEPTIAERATGAGEATAAQTKDGASQTHSTSVDTRTAETVHVLNKEGKPRQARQDSAGAVIDAAPTARQDSAEPQTDAASDHGIAASPGQSTSAQTGASASAIDPGTKEQRGFAQSSQPPGNQHPSSDDQVTAQQRSTRAQGNTQAASVAIGTTLNDATVHDWNEMIAEAGQTAAIQATQRSVLLAS